MLDRRATGEETCLTLAQQTAVAHHLLRVTREGRIVRQIHRADVSDNDRCAVLSALSSGSPTARRKTFVRRVGNTARVVDHHRRILNASSLSISDKDRLSNNRDRGRILPRRNKSTNLA